jgi:hypothetical protein
MKNSYRCASACLCRNAVPDTLFSFSQHVRHGKSERLPGEEFTTTRQDVGPHIERTKQLSGCVVGSVKTSGS